LKGTTLLPQKRDFTIATPTTAALISHSAEGFIQSLKAPLSEDVVIPRFCALIAPHELVEQS
jgi:hypothetical protein